MVKKIVVSGLDEAVMIRRANPEYAKRAAEVVRGLIRKTRGPALVHLEAVQAGLSDAEGSKRDPQ